MNMANPISVLRKKIIYLQHGHIGFAMFML